MKKQLTIIAAVCAGLVSQAVFAANVQMYGRVDNGLYFTNTKVNGKTENSFTMESGMGGKTNVDLRSSFIVIDTSSARSLALGNSSRFR